MVIEIEPPIQAHEKERDQRQRISLRTHMGKQGMVGDTAVFLIATAKPAIGIIMRLAPEITVIFPTIHEQAIIAMQARGARLSYACWFFHFLCHSVAAR